MVLRYGIFPIYTVYYSEAGRCIKHYQDNVEEQRKASAEAKTPSRKDKLYGSAPFDNPDQQLSERKKIRTSWINANQ